MSAPLPDKRMPILDVTLDTANPPISPFLRKLYKEYAERMGEAEALAQWHKLRAEITRHPGLTHISETLSEVRALSDKLRELDRTDAMMAQYTTERDELFSCKLESKMEEAFGESFQFPHKRDRRNFWEPVSIALTLFLLMALGMIGGVIWSLMQRSAP